MLSVAHLIPLPTVPLELLALIELSDDGFVYAVSLDCIGSQSSDRLRLARLDLDGLVRDQIDFVLLVEALDLNSSIAFVGNPDLPDRLAVA